jgi:hypothetical protein
MKMHETGDVLIERCALRAYCDREELRHRGWTRKWMSRLGTPDGWRRADPFDPPMVSPVWRRSLVENIEQTDDSRADRFVNDCIWMERGRNLAARREERLRALVSLRDQES